MNETGVPFRQSLKDRVATEVRAEVARQRLTHRELGERLKLAQPSVTKRLNGVIPFDLVDLERFAEALGVPVDQFLAAQTTAGAA